MKTSQDYLRSLAITVTIVALFALGAGSLFAQDYVNAQLPWHKAVLDSQGHLLAWYHPEKNLGYDQFLKLDWDFMEHKVPNLENNGLKVYLVDSIYNSETLQGRKTAEDFQHNPASTYAHFVDLLMGWYPYSGDEEAGQVVRGMLDYEIAHGTTPGDWDWAGVPFATSCDGDLEYGRCIRGMPTDFYGGIETDKVGELGLGYVLFYEMTGERKYLDAALKCANALAKHVGPGDATHTPWAYRVNARNGEIINGEDFGGMIVAPVRLFEELLRLGVGNTESFRKAHDLAWSWILKNPLNKSSDAWDRWTGYYEDVRKDQANINDMDSMMTAYYILSHDDPSTVDPEWEEHVGHLLDLSRELLGRGPFFGAWAIDEQERPHSGAAPHLSTGCCSRAGLSCRTSGWGAINAIYYEKTGDGSARENAFRSLNYATYFAASDGKIACCGLGAASPLSWFEDGYADAGRNFTWAMGAVPEFAPVGQDHLLHSSSVIQKVSYGNRKVGYRTFDNVGMEVLRLSFKPTRIVGGATALHESNDIKEEGYTVRVLQDGDYVVRIHRTHSNEVTVIAE